MPIEFTDQLVGRFQKPLIPEGEAAGVVTDVTLSGETLTVTKRSSTDKTATTSEDHSLPAGQGGLTAQQRATLTAIGKIGRDAADAADGGIVAVQTGAVNISIANTHTYTAEGEVGAFALSTQTANPRIMVGIKNKLVDDRGLFTVLYNGNQLTPDMAQDVWTTVGGNRVGTAANYSWYQILLSGVTVNAGAVTLQYETQIPSGLIPDEAVEGVVEGFAIIGTTDRAPASRLPNASASAAGIISAAFYERIAAAVQNDNPTDSALTHTQIEDADAVLLRDSSVTTGNEIAEIAFSELDERWYPQTAARTEVLDEYFDSEGWQAFAQGEIAITRVGNPPENQLFTTPGFVTTPGVPLGYDYTSAIVDVSPRPDDNRVLYMRVPIAVVDSGAVRLNLDLDGEAGSVPQTVQLDADQVTPPRRFREVDRNATHVVYGLQFTSIAQDAQLQMQQYDPAELNLDRISVQNIVDEVNASQRLGTTTLGDGSGVGLFVSALNGVSRTPLTLFSPTFDGDDAANQHGLAIGRVTLHLHSRSSTSIGFGAGHDTTHRFGGYVSYRDMAQSSVFNAAAAVTGPGLAGGVALDSEDFNDASTVSGAVTVYLARNAANQWGYYIEYATRSGYVGSGNFNISSDLDLFYEHSGASVSPTPAARTVETLVDWTRTAAGDHSITDALTEFPAAFAFSRALTSADDDKELHIRFAVTQASVTAAQAHVTWSFKDDIPVSEWRALASAADNAHANTYTSWSAGGAYVQRRQQLAEVSADEGRERADSDGDGGRRERVHARSAFLGDFGIAFAGG